MRRVRCSAPGKLFLGGEYAVLKGAEAVITAVSRRAYAETTSALSSVERTPILEAVHEMVSDFLNRRFAKEIGLPKIEVKSNGFTIDGHKTGLGSSAAVAASACGALFELAGLSVEKHRDEILEVAVAAHKRAQKGRGSGADVATSVLGGTVIFTKAGAREQIAPLEVAVAAVWSGASVSTGTMIEKIDAFEKNHPTEHQRCFDRLYERATHLAAAYRSRETKAVIAATREYGREMERLAKASEVPIVTNDLKRIAAIAAYLGGASKPSGAGGGDVAVALFETAESAEAFRVQCRQHGFRPLTLSVDAPGLRRETPTD
jgi:phosphomevalonate kinase